MLGPTYCLILKFETIKILVLNVRVGLKRKCMLNIICAVKCQLFRFLNWSKVTISFKNDRIILVKQQHCFCFWSSLWKFSIKENVLLKPSFTNIVFYRPLVFLVCIDLAFFVQGSKVIVSKNVWKQLSSNFR